MQNKTKTTLTIILLAITFLLVYSIHFEYKFPYHVDEWHHISEAIKLNQGQNYFSQTNKASLTESGFHIFLNLFLLSNIDLVLIYQYLPAIWAMIAGLVLFLTTYYFTQKNFTIALISLLFFASIKSNVNIAGLWFFTPLTFSIPIIYLYFYFFNSGIKNQKKSHLLLSTILICLLIPTHPISFLFSLPIIIVYSLANISYLNKIYRQLPIFIIIPIIGLILYKIIFSVDLINLIPHLFSNLIFKKGWGVLEIDNSFFELYSPIGYIFALIGLIYLATNKKLIEKYLIYIIWPLITLLYIVFYRLFEYSVLSPYQRNLYYFAISLPILSAFGFYCCLKWLSQKTKGYQYQKILLLTTSSIIMIFIFVDYFKINDNINLYQVINQKEYDALKFLRHQKPGVVISTPFISTALFPVSQKEPLSTIYFHNKALKPETEKFFLSYDCPEKNQLLEKYNIKYVISPIAIDCQYEKIYDTKNIFIYLINEN